MVSALSYDLSLGVNPYILVEFIALNDASDLYINKVLRFLISLCQQILKSY